MYSVLQLALLMCDFTAIRDMKWDPAVFRIRHSEACSSLAAFENEHVVIQLCTRTFTFLCQTLAGSVCNIIWQCARDVWAEGLSGTLRHGDTVRARDFSDTTHKSHCLPVEPLWLSCLLADPGHQHSPRFPRTVRIS